jgi:hypothetical protein
MNGYSIGDDGRSITCLRCGRTSHNPNDVAHRYCGYCHRFHGPAPEALPAIPAERLDAVCTSLLHADPNAEAVLLVVFHPNKTAQPVFASRVGGEYSPQLMADYLRQVADQISKAKADQH